MSELMKVCPECGSYYDARSLQCPCELIKEGDVEINKLRVYLAAAEKLAEACKPFTYLSGFDSRYDEEIAIGKLRAALVAWKEASK